MADPLDRRSGRQSRVLDSPWRATIADDRLRRSFTAIDFDDHAWSAAIVPGHWREIPDLVDSDGPVLYRTSFSHPVDDTSRHWLTFEGIHYASDIWLDGDYLGTTEGYFAPHTFEVTEQLNRTGEHAIAVEVIASGAGTPGATRDLTGVFNDPDVVGATWNAGGIWRPVRVDTTGPVRLSNLRAICTEATNESAVVQLQATMASEELRSVEVITTLVETSAEPDGDAPAHTQRSTHHLASGDTTVQWQVVVPDPQLWWPRALGEQPTYELDVEVIVDGQVSSDSQHRTIGLRSVDFDRYHLRINGERLFCKGAVVWPTGRALGAVTDVEIERDLALVDELGLDLVRVHTHVARPEFYEAADRRGLLIWQDLPLRGRAAKSLENPAARQAEQLVDLVGNHPSVVIWCGHDDPTASSGVTKSDSLRKQAQRLGFQEAPTWNKTVLDRGIARAFARADPSRPVIPHSGVLPGPAHPVGTDSHLWFGWGNAAGRDFADYARRFSNRVRWVSAFGAQSVPLSNEFCDPHRWPDLNWSNLAGEWGLDLPKMRSYVPPGDHAIFDRWVEATQSYQATILRRQIEELRRRKYAPTGGFSFMALADVRPAISFAIVDHDRRPKEAFGAVRDACRPVIVVADRMPTRLLPGEPVALAIDVVNDQRGALTQHVVTAELTWPGGSHQWRFGSDVDADASRQVGMVTWMVPNSRGAVRLVLALSDSATDEVIATNTYTAAIT